MSPLPATSTASGPEYCALHFQVRRLAELLLILQAKVTSGARRGHTPKHELAQVPCQL